MTDPLRAVPKDCPRIAKSRVSDLTISSSVNTEWSISSAQVGRKKGSTCRHCSSKSLI